MADVHQAHDALHRVGVVQLEGVVDGEGVDVDDGRLEPRFRQQAVAVLHQLPLGRHQEHVHLQPLGVGIEDLEVQLHVGHVKRHVLLGFPADHLAGVAFFHAVHLNLLDDHVAAAHCRDDFLLLDAGCGQETANRLRNDARVHDLALDNGVGRHLGGRDLHQLGLGARMVHHHQLDDAGADVEADRRLLSTQKPEQGHSRLG